MKLIIIAIYIIIQNHGLKLQFLSESKLGKKSNKIRPPAITFFLFFLLIQLGIEWTGLKWNLFGIENLDGRESENYDRNRGYWALGCIPTTAPQRPWQSCMSRPKWRRTFWLKPAHWSHVSLGGVPEYGRSYCSDSAQTPLPPSGPPYRRHRRRRFEPWVEPSP